MYQGQSRDHYVLLTSALWTMNHVKFHINPPTFTSMTMSWDSSILFVISRSYCEVSVLNTEQSWFNRSYFLPSNLAGRFHHLIIWIQDIWILWINLGYCAFPWYAYTECIFMPRFYFFLWPYFEDINFRRRRRKRKFKKGPILWKMHSSVNIDNVLFCQSVYNVLSFLHKWK